MFFHEAGHTYKGQRIQGKCSYPCYTPNALLRITVCSARYALLGIVSINVAGHIYTGQTIQAGKCSYSEQCIQSRTCRYTELSEVRHSYLECLTPNIGTIRSLASYKILLRLEQTDVLNTETSAQKKHPIRTSISPNLRILMIK